jgi:NADH:ubiquinone oxidoreductase subunit 5 (subunit L)/multisubunit Na+/H+ antiporter MnhA subunit
MSLVFFGFGHPAAGALGLVAALYHTLNHAVFKGLLFLGAGSILHATGLRDLNHMGGLARSMPATAFHFLVGALAISALPPLNGFVSEWLTFHAALQAPLLEHSVVRSLVPLFAATLALAGALTAMCFVKVYGVAFLGQPRSKAKVSGDAGPSERLGLAWLSAGCLVLGLFPAGMLQMLNQVGASLTGHGLPAQALESSNWLWLVPTHPAEASYSPLIFFVVVLAVVLLTVRLVRIFYHGRVRRADPWDCGFPEQTTRMQDTADALASRSVSSSDPLPHEAQPRGRRKRTQVLDEGRRLAWPWLYLPVARAVEFVSAKIGLLQRGRISTYLLYSFLTLIALLVFVR